MDGGGLDLGGEEGREWDMGDQSGAGIVDEGIDLLCLLTAGFDLEKTKIRSELKLLHLSRHRSTASLPAVGCLV